MSRVIRVDQEVHDRLRADRRPGERGFSPAVQRAIAGELLDYEISGSSGDLAEAADLEAALVAARELVLDGNLAANVRRWSGSEFVSVAAAVADPGAPGRVRLVVNQGASR